MRHLVTTALAVLISSGAANVAQETPNAFGPSPLGSCPGTGGDASCQFKIVNGHVEGESYYPCPPRAAPPTWLT
jgi:hypothetical protein